MDTSPKKRRETPEFYGFIPATGRGIIFFLMTVNSTAQFLSKIMAMALLGAVSKTWAFGYIVGDLGMYLLYTLVRNDFFYFIPIQSYIGSIGYSLLMRIADKVRKVMLKQSNLLKLTKTFHKNRLSPTSQLYCK